MTNPENNLFTISFKPARVIGLFLGWSFLLHRTLLPFEPNRLLTSVIMAVFIFLVTQPFESMEDTVSLSKSDVLSLTSYLLFATVVSWPFLFESLSGDEFYHIGRAATYTYLPDSLKNLGLLRHIPINDLNAHLSMLLIIVGFIVWALLKKLPSPSGSGAGKFKFILFLIFLAVLGGLSPLKPEPHPPLRLLPLFLSQLVFGMNDLAFRLPGLVAVATAAFLVRKILTQSPLPSWVGFLGGLVTMLIPTTLHVSNIVEPSVWAYLCGTLCLYFVLLALKHDDARYMIYAAITIGLGTLLRQNTVIYWPVVFLFAISKPVYRKNWPRIFLPLLFALPYFFTVFHLGHPAVGVVIFKPHTTAVTTTPAVQENKNLTDQNSTAAIQPPDVPKSSLSKLRVRGYKVLSPLKNIVKSWTSGIGPRTILKSSTPLWVLFLIAGSFWIIFFTTNPLKKFFFILPIGYALFYSIDWGLWGPGRYQAEYIAPAIVAAIVMILIEAPNRFRPSLMGLLILMGFYSLHLNFVAPADIHSPWYQKRITTEPYRPYKQTLDFLQKQGTDGRFLMMAGSGWASPWSLWLRGFTAEECDNHERAAASFEEFLKLPDLTPDKFVEFLRSQNIHYFVIQYGEKRDFETRPKSVNQLLEILFPARPIENPFVLLNSFVSGRGASLDVYKFPADKYSWGSEVNLQ